MSGTDQSSCYWGNNIGSDSLLWGGVVDNGRRQMTQQRVVEGKEQHTGDKREELQTLVPPPLFLAKSGA